ncbi:MAG: ABC transporter ATP-binding protein [Desulfatirhabdiaceae bacterium]
MIVCEGISKSWTDTGNHTQKTLENVDLSVAADEFVCLIGPSGCGKTTLLNIVAGFVHPTQGSARFNGKPITGPGPDRGVVFQDPTLFPWLTASQNIAFGLINLGIPAAQRQAMIDDGLRMVGLEAFAQAYPHELSGGMRQRIALARILVLKPKALLMDEPFSALDAINREYLQDELLNIWQRRRIPVIFVTHNADEAAYLADRIIIMGHPPHSVQQNIPVNLPRPRCRSGEALCTIALTLRRHLTQLPSCIPLTENREVS